MASREQCCCIWCVYHRCDKVQTQRRVVSGVW